MFNVVANANNVKANQTLINFAFAMKPLQLFVKITAVNSFDLGLNARKLASNTSATAAIQQKPILATSNDIQTARNVVLIRYLAPTAICMIQIEPQLHLGRNFERYVNSTFDDSWKPQDKQKLAIRMNC